MATNKEATLAGQTLAGRYDVLELVGMGGMGAVYRARDRELDEVVALKVIKRELADVPVMVERFRHEVKLARRVTHLNVARTFELGSADGVMFCTMELVEGEPLSKRLARQRVVPVAEAVSIACAICDGLAAAHAADVIHRDIKPDNVLVAADGRIVLADFGVAAVGVGATGELSGTPAYMAPEQARGEPATPASDVFAVGVILREMVTGARTPGAATPGVPDDLLRVIEQATDGAVARRIGTAAGLRRAIEPWAPKKRAPTSTPRVEHDVGDVITIVVIAPQAKKDPTLYLAEGVHAELLARLGRLPRVRVLPRVASETDSTVIGVCFDIENGLAVRITYPSGPPSQLHFPLAIEHVLSTADAIAATLNAAVVRTRTAVQATNEAYDLLLAARCMINHDLSKIPDAIVQLRRAHELAPADARIMANLAILEVRQVFFMPDSAVELLPQAIRLARHAVTSAPDLADAQMAAGHVELTTGSPVAAARHFRLAIARAPHLAEGHEQLGRMLFEAGYVDAALERLDDAIAISPNLRSARWEIARAQALAEDWAEHDRLVEELVAEGLDRPLSRARYAWWRGDWKQLAELRTNTSASSALWPKQMDAVCAIFLDGAWAATRDALLQHALSDTPSRRRKTFNCQVAAEAAVFSGDIDVAIKLISHATDYGLYDYDWLQRCKLLAPLRADSRFAALRAPIKQRADSILDALYGDQSAALSETAFA